MALAPRMTGAIASMCSEEIGSPDLISILAAEMAATADFTAGFARLKYGEMQAATCRPSAGLTVCPDVHPSAKASAITGVDVMYTVLMDESLAPMNSGRGVTVHASRANVRGTVVLTVVWRGRRLLHRQFPIGRTALSLGGVGWVLASAIEYAAVYWPEVRALLDMVCGFD